MNDPFQQHGVKNLSASSINEYIANPARWILHVSGFRDRQGVPAMWRGIAVDKALSRAAFEQSISEAQILQWAIDEFDARYDAAQSADVIISQKKEHTKLI